MKNKPPKFKEVDLSKCKESNHPDIRSNRKYLVKIAGQYFLGYFSRQWYGWNFDDWGTSGIQLDEPGINSSGWEGIWELVK